ncbi:MAG: nucleotidyltransferase family protein [Acidithiobacillus sp.]|nr:nucleotidyltransferase family protein [Acidithiobacillus sp.]
MRPSEILRRHREDVLQIIAAHHATNPRVFGSVARGEDIEGSDIDILVDRQPGLTLLEQAYMTEELQDLLKVHVDVITSGAPSQRFLSRALQDARSI